MLSKFFQDYRHNSIGFSFSGGRTSAMMVFFGVLACRELGIKHKVSFANTGREHEKTYEFIHNVETKWGIPITWLEVDYDSKLGYKEVDFFTANRNGKPLETVIQRYGLYNVSYPHCTRETKGRVLDKWRKVNGLEYVCIGIRADEFDRVSDKAEEKKILYPLVWKGIQKHNVLLFFKEQPFDLEIPEHLGNCVTCFKKSLSKLSKIALENPEMFDFDREMERKYENFKPERQNRLLPIRIHRGNRTVDDIFNVAYGDKPDDFHTQAGCAESCEAWS